MEIDSNCDEITKKIKPIKDEYIKDLEDYKEYIMESKIFQKGGFKNFKNSTICYLYQKIFQKRF